MSNQDLKNSKDLIIRMPYRKEDKRRYFLIWEDYIPKVDKIVKEKLAKLRSKL